MLPELAPTFGEGEPKREGAPHPPPQYGPLFEEALGLQLVPFKELAAAVEGVRFLRHFGPAGEI